MPSLNRWESSLYFGGKGSMCRHCDRLGFIMTLGIRFMGLRRMMNWGQRFISWLCVLPLGDVYIPVVWPWEFFRRVRLSLYPFRKLKVDLSNHLLRKRIAGDGGKMEKVVYPSSSLEHLAHALSIHFLLGSFEFLYVIDGRWKLYTIKSSLLAFHWWVPDLPKVSAPVKVGSTRLEKLPKVSKAVLNNG